MTFLYGDSTDSGLELNYIELLREFLDFACQVVLSEDRIHSAKLAVDERARAGDAEIERLRALGIALADVLDKHQNPDENAATNRAIDNLRSAILGELTRSSQLLQSETDSDQRQVQAKQHRERSGTLKLLEPLLLSHELPDSRSFVDISLNPEATGYHAEMHGACKQGLSWRFIVDIPKSSVFHQPVKVGHYAPDLVIQLPEKSGLVRKSLKLRDQKLATMVIGGVTTDFGRTRLALRGPAQGDDSGLDIELRSSAPRATVIRVSRGENAPPFEVRPEDEAALLELGRQVASDSQSLMAHRCSLADARFDGKPIRDLDDPLAMIVRLLERIGPVIQDIAAHSLAPTELVLKRVLADDRREEIFASKADLLGKLAAVPPRLRAIFKPLGLGDLADAGDYEPTAEYTEVSASTQNVAPDDDETTDIIDDVAKMAAAPPKVPPRSASESESVQSSARHPSAAETSPSRPARPARTSSIPPRRSPSSSQPPPGPAPISGGPHLARARPVQAPATSRPKAISQPPALPVSSNGKKLGEKAAPPADSIDAALAELEAETSET